MTTLNQRHEARRDAANARNQQLYQRLAKDLENDRILFTHLYNQGMRNPHGYIAYRGVMRATGNPELAWEAARHEELIFRRSLQLQSQARYAGMKSDLYHWTVNHTRRLESDADRAEEIERIANMPNPWTEMYRAAAPAAA